MSPSRLSLRLVSAKSQIRGGKGPSHRTDDDGRAVTFDCDWSRTDFNKGNLDPYGYHRSSE
jgi:hypothetical protein